MAEENGAAPQVRMSVMAQFVRDMSFENVVAQKGVSGTDVQPDIQVAVSLDARKRQVEHQYEIVTKYKVTSKNKATGDVLFLLEVDYGGVFHVEGVPDDQLHPFLLIECPRMLFPFVRRIISDVTRDGGFPPLNIDTVDFLALYRQEMARRAKRRRRPFQTEVFEKAGPSRGWPLRPLCPKRGCAQLGDQGGMRRRFIGGDPGRQRLGARAGAPIIALRRSGCGVFRGLVGQTEIGLAATDQL